MPNPPPALPPPLVDEVAAIVARHLGLAKVDTSADLLDLGANPSILAGVMRDLAIEGDITPEVRTLLQRPTVSGLAAVAAARRLATSTSSSDVVFPAPLSQGHYEQLFGSLWWRSPLQVAATFQLTGGSIDNDALNCALAQLIRRHSGLRSRFSKRNGDLVLVVQEDAPARVQHRKLADTDNLRAAVRLDLQTVIDRRKAPLIKVVHYVAPEARDHLAIIVDHGVCDGWGLDVVVHDLGRLYLNSGGSAPPAGQITNWVQDQHAMLRSQPVAELRDVWVGRLGSRPAALRGPIPAGAPGGPVRWAKLYSPGLAAGVRALARRVPATPFVMLGGATVAATARYLDVSELSVMINVLNRPTAETQSMVASCTAEYWMRFTDLFAQPVESVIAAFAKESAAAAEYSWISMDVLAQQLWSTADPVRDRPGLYFGMLHQWGKDVALAGAELEPVTLEEAYGTPGLAINVAQMHSGEYMIETAVPADGLDAEAAVAVGTELAATFSAKVVEVRQGLTTPEQSREA